MESLLTRDVIPGNVLDRLDILERKVELLERFGVQLELIDALQPTWLSAPLTSTSWDGDSFSDAAATQLDLSSVFGCPDGISAVVLYVAIRDSASAANDAYIIFAPNSTSGTTGFYAGCGGLANDMWSRVCLIVPCDANGDIYYTINASGAGTTDIWLQVWGWFE